jgi:hypothetical protein
MNWIDFSKEKPKAPGRQIRVRYHDLSEDIWWIGGTCGFGPQPTHWAEIEPPVTKTTQDLLQPTPDPFEEWWYGSAPANCDKPSAQTGWDAAIRWKEGK